MYLYVIESALKKLYSVYCIQYSLGIQIRNMKMVFNIYGTWRWVTFEKLMMKIYDFFLFG